MPIEEKKKPLEFEFVEEKGNGVIYEIKYEEDGREDPISIKNQGVSITFSTNFFEEVYDFLASKGILKVKEISSSISVANSFSSAGDGFLPLPKIGSDSTNYYEKEEVENDLVTSQFNDGLASFDISLTTAPKIQPKEEVKKESDKKPTSSEVIKRPVIRTRVIDEDHPLGAENQAAEIRGKGEAGEKSSIRRV